MVCSVFAVELWKAALGAALPRIQGTEQTPKGLCVFVAVFWFVFLKLCFARLYVCIYVGAFLSSFFVHFVIHHML